MTVAKSVKCKTCKYLSSAGSMKCCDYFLTEGKKRTNAKVEDCVDYEKRPRKRRRSKSEMLGLYPAPKDFKSLKEY